MKYLDYPELESLSRALTFESAECKVFTRLEAYSCKAVNKEKRLFKALESAYQHTASTSPPDYLEETLASPFGRLDQPSARKTLFLLISLLNGAFPDHDFSQVNPSDFRKESSPAVVLHSLSTTLQSLRSNSGASRSYSTFTGSFNEKPAPHPASASPSSPTTRRNNLFGRETHAGLASLFDDIMDIRDCEVYTFHPDMDSDPHACPEPEEEGFDNENPPGYWSDGDDEEMQTVNVVTPRRGSLADIDTPMFDEDLDGGFTKSGTSEPHGPYDSSGAYATSEGPQTPRSSASQRAGDFTSANRGQASRASGKSSQVQSGSMSSAFASSSISSASSFDMDDDDGLEGIGGLLWSTFAFFYNRRLKRVLFVSVWSRMNNATLGGGMGWTSPLTRYEPALPLPPALQLPGAVSNAPTRRNAGGTADPVQPKHPSPAKLALTRGRKGRGRVASGSPAPSALSPFPHASPSAAQRAAAAAAEQDHELAVSSTRQTRNSQLAAQAISLDAAALSMSAPTTSSTPAAMGTDSAPSTTATKRGGDADGPHGKRLRRQVAA